MVKQAGAATLAGEVAARLRAAVLSGRFHAGQWLRPADLRLEYGVSTTVVRDALARLAEQHLAVLSPNRGYHVVRFGQQEVQELVEYRIVTETAALRFSVERGGEEWEEAAVAAFRRLRTAEAEHGHGSDAWFVAHGAFHLALLSACGNALLLEASRDALAAGDLFLRWSRRASAAVPAVPSGHRDVDAEHDGILAAALARDADRAATLYREHLQRAAARMAAARRAPA
ncbi:MAG: GntR family transcriptional regulator [Microbacteriaceae bacterium]|nr:GntR family transcriptional regulator [Microbacteriaceae bacterium]